jgi:hypothetical protein
MKRSKFTDAGRFGHAVRTNSHVHKFCCGTFWLEFCGGRMKSEQHRISPLPQVLTIP